MTISYIRKIVYSPKNVHGAEMIDNMQTNQINDRQYANKSNVFESTIRTESFCVKQRAK